MKNKLVEGKMNTDAFEGNILPDMLSDFTQLPVLVTEINNKAVSLSKTARVMHYAKCNIILTNALCQSNINVNVLQPN